MADCAAAGPSGPTGDAPLRDLARPGFCYPGGRGDGEARSKSTSGSDAR